MRSVRIFSDGTPRGTHIYDAETGDQIDGIQSLSLEVGLRKRTRAVLTEKVYVQELVVTEVEAGTEEEQDAAGEAHEEAIEAELLRWEVVTSPPLAEPAPLPPLMPILQPMPGWHPRSFPTSTISSQPTVTPAPIQGDGPSW